MKVNDTIALCKKMIKEDTDARPHEDYQSGRDWIDGRIDALNELIAILEGKQ